MVITVVPGIPPGTVESCLNTIRNVRASKHQRPQLPPPVFCSRPNARDAQSCAHRMSSSSAPWEDLVCFGAHVSACSLVWGCALLLLSHPVEYGTFFQVEPIHKPSMECPVIPGRINSKAGMLSILSEF
ncbi:hypothetical protein HJG60_008440 [Phyllostomus discolor]|uniref:Uncharacterized protein n=1 Tax=Phyllostomus discolor TaxID=89673 RepID=A0A834DJQ4_9CHIR|nr:hypothetical protein HJG60_008440 [Phyllostomus discolor]